MTSNRKIKIAMMVAIIMLFAIAVSTMGVSYAVWTSPDGSIGGGSSTASPSVTPDKNNVWAKYFKFNVISEEEKTEKNLSGNLVELVSFYMDGDDCAGINLPDMYIPDVIWMDKDGNVLPTLDGVAATEYTTYQVYRIANSVLADSTLKSQLVTIHISESVREIDYAAFMGLSSLEAVYFENLDPCEIGEYAFSGCFNLKNVYNVKGGEVNADETAFEGSQITVSNGKIVFSQYVA